MRRQVIGDLVKCESCGAVLTEGVVYCSHCGSQAPEPLPQPYASTADLMVLSERLGELENKVDLHAEASKQAWSRLSPLEDSVGRHRRILNSSKLYTDMFGWRVLTMVGYGLLSGLIVSAVVIALALATGLLHR